MDVHGAAVAEIVKAPHLVEQLVARVDAVGRGREVVQQLQLLRGRVDLLAVDDQLVAVEVDDELVKGQALFCVVGDLAAAQHRVDARHQLLHLKGLDDVVVRAHLQTRDAVAHVALGGEHDDRGLGLLADLRAHAPAVEHGEHDIEQHQIRLLLFKLLHGLAAVIGDTDLEALLVQIHTDEIGDIPVVLHHQNIACHRKSSR